MKNPSTNTAATIPSYQDIAQATFGTLWPEATPQDWALVVHKLREALREQQDGPDRDAVLEEAAEVCRRIYFDSKSEHGRMFEQGHEWAAELCERRIRTLKNAAPQAGPSAGNHSGEDFRPARAASEAGAEPQWTPTYQGDNIWTGAVPPCWLLVNDVLHPENEPWVTYWDGQGYPLQSNHYRVIGYYRTPLPPTKRSATDRREG